jgi:hypothetical protein
MKLIPYLKLSTYQLTKNMFNNKKTIIAGILVFAAAISSHVFQNETQAQEPLVVPDTASSLGGEGTNQAGREILALLADMKSVRLDESIFSDPMFQSLQDISVELIAEPKGRPNPFAPIGKDAVLADDFSGFATGSPRNIPFNSGDLNNTKPTTTKSGKAGE